jgi:hypothetical protein
MKISTYHLNKFIIENHKDDPEYIKLISKIYKGNIPECVLRIFNKSPELEDELRQIQIKMQRKLALQLEQELKVAKWIERRNAGNIRAQELRQKKKEEEVRKLKEFKALSDENYVKRMQPIWKEKIENIINQREMVYNNLWFKETS